MSWSEEAYRSVTSILEDIKAHPFIRELALGTLSKDKFSRYIAQDKIYLKGYAAEMEAISQMLPPGRYAETVRKRRDGIGEQSPRTSRRHHRRPPRCRAHGRHFGVSQTHIGDYPEQGPCTVTRCHSSLHMDIQRSRKVSSGNRLFRLKSIQGLDRMLFVPAYGRRRQMLHRAHGFGSITAVGRKTQAHDNGICEIDPV